ncbi:MAG TPA: NUDIX hydrolase [Chthoniobacterales bacterium]
MSHSLPNWTSDPTLPREGNLTADHGAWHTLGRTLEYNGPYAKVYHETVATPARPEGIMWTVVRRKSAIVVAAKTTDQKWLMIRQERVAIRQTIWEFPAGQIELPDAQSFDFPALLSDTVWRELREETGYGPGSGNALIPLGVFFPSVGFTDEHSHLFLADGLVPHQDGAQHDEGERIVECRAFSTEELREMIASGEVRDANTLATFARLTVLSLI